MSIGKRISDLRKQYSYSQEYVAEKIGVSRQAVSKWEQDQTAPDTYNLIALAELFNVSVEYLATGKSEQQFTVPEPQPNQNKLTTKKLIGLILLGIGLIALILGILFSEILIILSVYLLVGGILCLSIRKNLWFVIMWTYTIMTFLMISILTRYNLFIIFNPAIYKNGGVSMGMIVSYVFWIIVVSAIAISVYKAIRAIKNKRKKQQIK